MVYFNFCNRSRWNLANDAEVHCAGAAFFTCFGLQEYWTKVLPKGKLPEDDLRSTLYQVWKVYFKFCNWFRWNLANDAEVHIVLEQPLLPVLAGENTEQRCCQRTNYLKMILDQLFTRSGRFNKFLQWMQLKFGKWCWGTLYWSSLFHLFWAVKIWNKGFTKWQMAWRWLEVNPAPVQEGLFQLLQ